MDFSPLFYSPEHLHNEKDRDQYLLLNVCPLCKGKHAGLCPIEKDQNAQLLRLGTKLHRNMPGTIQNRQIQTSAVSNNKNFVQNSDCVICQGEINKDKDTQTLKCNHRFHSKCLKEWFEQKRQCPICRRNFNF